jgi:hypothetical protein
LPEIDDRFRKLDAQMRLRLEQRQSIDERLQHMLIAPRPDLLASSEEQEQLSRIDRLAPALEGREGPEAAELRLRLERLRGFLHFGLEMRYHERLTLAHRHLRELDADVDALTAQYDAFVRTRQAATHSYVGYDAAIDGLRSRVSAAQERLDSLMARQGHTLETVAIDELGQRRERLEAYRNQARFAFADSYDRASKAQAR